MGLDAMVEKFQSERFGGNMENPFTIQTPKLAHIPIIVSVLLLAGCSSSISIPAPGLIKPASMSPQVSVNPNQKYQKARKFSATSYRQDRWPYLVQKRMSEAVKGSGWKAIKDIEIYIEYREILIFPFPGERYLGVRVNGSVIEAK